MSYLTRAQAVEQMTGDGRTSESEANSMLDRALSMYPQCVRTTFTLITGYRAGSLGAYPDGMNKEDLFTIGLW